MTTAARPTDPTRQIVATLALAGFTLMTLASFVRVFDRWDFARVAFGAALCVHVMSLTIRMLRGPGWTLAIVLPPFAVWTLCLFAFADDLWFGLPTTSTWASIESTFGAVATEFPTAIAPVPLDSHWLSLAVAAAVLTAAVSELFAFGARAIGESLAPGAFVFVAIAVLGTPRDATMLTVGLIVSGIIAVAAIGWHHDRTVRLGQRSHQLPASALTVVVVAIVVAAGATFVGPRLPGADAPPIVDPADAGGGSVTTIISPLVDIRARLTNQSRQELFEVTAARPSYWRSTTLPEFDGQQFALPARALEEVEPIGTAPSDPNVQSVVIAGLGGRTIPAAPEPVQADGVTKSGERVRLRINRDTSTLLGPQPLARGDRYTVVSASVALTAEQLTALDIANDVDPIYTELPSNFPTRVAEIALEVTKSAATPYEKLIALQNWFRTFTYSLNVPSGHDTPAIVAFLQNRVGYCEQFSATFAAMARTLGYPSRVAVGFNSGTSGPNNSFVVRGENAHAWPEVYFTNLGWVAFEPTPGRAIPGAERYTGVSPEDTDQARTTTTTAPTAASNPSPTTTAAATPATASPPSSPRGSSPTTDTTRPARGVPWVWIGLFAVVLGAVTAPNLIRRLVHERERHLPPADATTAAWHRSQRAALRAGAVTDPGATTSAWVAATTDVAPVAARPMRDLGDAYDLASYGPEPTHDQIATDDVARWAEQIERITDDALTARQRIRSWFRVR